MAKNDVYNSNFGAPTFESLTRGVGKVGVDADYRNDGPDYDDAPQITFYGNVVPPDIDQPDTVSPALELLDPVPDTYLGLGAGAGSELVFLATFNEQLLNFEILGNWALSGPGSTGMSMSSVVLSSGPTAEGKWVYGVYASHGSLTEGILTLAINPGSANSATTIRDAFGNAVASETFDWFIDLTRPRVDAMTPDPDTQPLLILGNNWGDGSSLVWFDLTWNEYIPNNTADNTARYTMHLKDGGGNTLASAAPITAYPLSSNIPSFSGDGDMVTRVKFTQPSTSLLNQTASVELVLNQVNMILDRAGNDMLAEGTTYVWSVDTQAPTWTRADPTCTTVTPPIQLSPGVVVGPEFTEVEFDEFFESVDGQGPIYDPANWIIDGMAANSPQAVSVASVVRTTSFGASPSRYKANFVSSSGIASNETGPMTVTLTNVADISGNAFVGAPLSFTHHRVIDDNGSDLGAQYPTATYTPSGTAPPGWNGAIQVDFVGVVQPMTVARAAAAWDLDLPAGVAFSRVDQVTGAHGVTAHQIHFTWSGFSGVGTVKVKPAGLNLAWDAQGPEGVRAKVGCAGAGGRPLSYAAQSWVDPATYWHEVIIDTTGPSILSWSPSAGVTAAASFGSSITVTFDKPIQETVSVSIAPNIASGSSIIVGAVAYPSATTLTIPLSTFTVEAGDAFIITLANVQDLNGSSLEGSNSAAWTLADTDSPYIMSTLSIMSTVDANGDVESPWGHSASWDLDFTSIPTNDYLGVQGVVIGWNEPTVGFQSTGSGTFAPSNWEVTMGANGDAFPSDCIVEIIAADSTLGTPDGLWDQSGNPALQTQGHTLSQVMFLHCVDQAGAPRIITAAVAAAGVRIKPLTGIVDIAGNNVVAGHAPILLSCTAPEVAPTAAVLSGSLDAGGSDSVDLQFTDSDNPQVAHHYKMFTSTDGGSSWVFGETHYAPSSSTAGSLGWSTPYSFKIISYNSSESLAIDSNVVAVTTPVEPSVYYSPGALSSKAQPLSPENYGGSGYLPDSAFDASGNLITPLTISDLEGIRSPSNDAYGSNAVTLRPDGDGRWIFVLGVVQSPAEISAGGSLTGSATGTDAELYNGWSLASHVEYTYFDLDDVNDVDGFMINSGTGALLPNRPVHTVALTKGAQNGLGTSAKLGYLVFPNTDSEDDWNNVFTDSVSNFGSASAGNDRFSWLPPLAPSTRYVVAFRTVHMDGAAAGAAQYGDWMIFTGAGNSGVSAVDYAGSGWSNHIDIIAGNGAFDGALEGADGRLVTLAPYLPEHPAVDAPVLEIEDAVTLKVSWPHAPVTSKMGLVPDNDTDFFRAELFKDGVLAVASDVTFHGPGHASPTGAVVEQFFGLGAALSESHTWQARVSVRNFAGVLSVATSAVQASGLGGMSNQVVTTEVYTSTPFYVGITAHSIGGSPVSVGSANGTSAVQDSAFDGVIRFTFYNDWDNSSPTTMPSFPAGVAWGDCYTVRVADDVLGVDGNSGSETSVTWRPLTSGEIGSVGFVQDAWYHQFDFSALKQHGRWIQIVIHGENGVVALPEGAGASPHIMLPATLPDSPNWVGEAAGAGSRHCEEAAVGTGTDANTHYIGEHWYNIVWHTNGPVVLDPGFTSSGSPSGYQGAAVFRHVWHAEDATLQSTMGVNSSAASQGWVMAKSYAHGNAVPEWGWFRGYDQHDHKNWYDEVAFGYPVSNATWGAIEDPSKTPSWGKTSGWGAQGSNAVAANIVMSFWAVTDYPLVSGPYQSEQRMVYGMGTTALTPYYYEGEVFVEDSGGNLVTARSQGWLLEAHGFVHGGTHAGRGILQVIVTDAGGASSSPLWDSNLAGVSPPLKISIFDVKSSFNNTTSQFQFLDFRVVDLQRASLTASGNTFPWTSPANPSDWKSQVACTLTFAQGSGTYTPYWTHLGDSTYSNGVTTQTISNSVLMADNAVIAVWTAAATTPYVGMHAGWTFVDATSSSPAHRKIVTGSTVLYYEIESGLYWSDTHWDHSKVASGSYIIIYCEHG